MRQSVMRPVILAVVTMVAACAQQAPNNTFPVFFTENSSTLDDAGQTIVTNAAVVARKFPFLPVTVRGYADKTATPDVAALSQARADTVAAQLQADGVPASRITRQAAGVPTESQPGVERRRVEIDIGNP